MNRHDKYKEKANAFYQTMDIKPKKKDKKHIAGQARMFDKTMIRKELEAIENHDDDELLYQLDKEAEEASDCYHYGPCERCLSREEEE